MTTMLDGQGNVIYSDSGGGVTDMTSSGGLDTPSQFNPRSSLRQESYDFTSRIFPDDLGQEDNAHYMIININVPVSLSASGKFDQLSRFQNGTILNDDYSTVDKLRFTDNGLSTPGSFQSWWDKRALSPPRYTRRIKESIALHMPNGGLVYTEENKYEEISMTALAGSFIGSAVSAAAGAFFPGEVGKVARDAMMSLSDATGSAIKTGSQLLGYPINPRAEVLFSTRPQRQWMFEVFLVPRSENESKIVKQIIQSLRFYAAPEISNSGWFYIPPAEFDITFFWKGKENQNLPRINTCVLERIDVDYAPENTYSTFRNGHSVAVRLSLGFREVEILHKTRVYQGF